MYMVFEEFVKLLYLLLFNRWWVPISYTTPSRGFADTKSKIWISPGDDFLHYNLSSKFDV